MASNNVVELVIDLKVEGKADLKKYSKELKAFAKIIDSVNKDLKKYSTVAKENSKAQDGVAKSTARNKAAMKALKQEVAKMKKELADANKQFDKSKESNVELSKTLKNVGSAVKTVGIAAAGSAVGLYVAVGAVTELNKQMEVFARQGNLSVDDFKALAYATEQFGISADQIADKMKDFEDRVGEAATSGTGVFLDLGDVIGLTKKETQELAKELQNVDGREGYLEVVRLMEQAGAGASQITFALESIGNDMSRLLPLWQNGGKELQRLEKRYKDMAEALQLSNAEQKEMILLTEQVGLTQKALSESAKKLTATFSKPLEDAFLAVQTAAVKATQSIVDFINSGKDISDLSNINDIDIQIGVSGDKISDIDSQIEQLQDKTFSGFLGQLGDKVGSFADIGFESSAEFYDAWLYGGEDFLDAYTDGVSEVGKETLKMFSSTNKERITDLQNAKKAEQEKIEAAENRRKEIEEGEKALSKKTGTGTDGAINAQEQNTLKAINNRFKTEETKLQEKYELEKSLADKGIIYAEKRQSDLAKALIEKEEKFLSDKADLAEEYSSLAKTDENKAQYDKELKSIEDVYEKTKKSNENKINKFEKDEAEARTTKLKLDEELAKKQNELSLKYYDDRLIEIQKLTDGVELEFSIGMIGLDEYEKRMNELLDMESNARSGRSFKFLDADKGLDEQSPEYYTAKNQELRVDDDKRILNEKVNQAKAKQVELEIELLRSSLDVAKAEERTADVRKLNMDIIKLEVGLRDELSEAAKAQLIADKEAQLIAAEKSSLTKDEYDFQKEILEAELRLAQAGEDTVVIQKAKLALVVLELNSRTDITQAEKDAALQLEIQIQKQNTLTAAAKKAREEKDKENKANIKALEEIEGLNLKLLKLKGKTDAVQIEAQRESAINAIYRSAETSGISDENRDEKIDLTNKIFNEQKIDAQFNDLKTKLDTLMQDYANADTYGEQIDLSKQIPDLVEQIGAIEGLDPNQIYEVATAWDAWNKSMENTGVTMMDIGGMLTDGFTDAFMSIIDGSKSAGDAFRDMATQMLLEMIKIQLQAIIMQAIGIGADGAATGGGMMSLFAGFFHNGGSPSDANVDTREVKSLQSDEMVSVINKNEHVVTNNEYRNMKENGAGNNQAPIFNQQLVLNPADLQRSISKTDEYQQDMISFISANQQQIKNILS